MAHEVACSLHELSVQTPLASVMAVRDLFVIHSNLLLVIPFIGVQSASSESESVLSQSVSLVDVLVLCH